MQRIDLLAKRKLNESIELQVGKFSYHGNLCLNSTGQR